MHAQFMRDGELPGRFLESSEGLPAGVAGPATNPPSRAASSRLAYDELRRIRGGEECRPGPDAELDHAAA